VHFLMQVDMKAALTKKAEATSGDMRTLLRDKNVRHAGIGREGATVVASTYTRVGGLYDLGFRHDSKRPLETLADYCLGCYTNMNLPSRIDLIERYIKRYEADGFLINSVKSCNSFSVGQLLVLRELEKRTGVPGGFVESDLVDPRYFGKANIDNRLQSYFQMLEAKKRKGER